MSSKKSGSRRPDIILKRPFTGDLLTTSEAAEYLGLGRFTLRDWRRLVRRGGPDYVKIHAHAVRYRKQALELFLRKRTVRTGART
jgi:excisionase family DNA binding protein